VCPPSRQPGVHLRGITVGGRTYFARGEARGGSNQVKLNGCQLCSASGDTFRTWPRLGANDSVIRGLIEGLFQFGKISILNCSAEEAPLSLWR